jgi:hypothetical protein
MTLELANIYAEGGEVRSEKPREGRISRNHWRVARSDAQTLEHPLRTPSGGTKHEYEDFLVL